MTIKVRGGPKAKRFLRDFLETQMEPPFFPVSMKEMKARFHFREGKPERMNVGSAEVIPVPLSHPNGGYGFKIVEKGKSFVFLTDNELGMVHPGGLKEGDYVSLLNGATLLFHDSQYTGEEYGSKKGWGHSTFTSSLRLASAAKVRSLGFLHHDPERTDDDLDNLVKRMQEKVKRESIPLQVFGVRESMEITV